VIDNNGGGIFSTLSQRGVAGFEEVFGTPHDRDIAAIARSLGVPAKTISSQSELKSELKTPVSGISVVVVTAPDRDTTADHLKNIYASVDSM
jgi:2-succinyl-5-enolpyruvyl-6-hydroxy-3-cyclohexene-1-carboxylate synthase